MRRLPLRLAIVAIVAFAIAGCQDDISTPFPAGLEPFDDDAEPAALDGTVVEQLTTRSVDSDFIRVYGRGFILVPPAEVYAAAHDPDAMIAVCSTTSQTVMLDNEDYDLSFLVHYYVDDILDVEWDDQWRGDVVLGSLDAPELVMIKHQKIQGSDFIALSEGSVQLFATDDPAVTELRFVEHLDALQAGEGDVIAGMQSNYDRLLALAHGDPLPPCFAGAPP
jgi:hypothetical protein